MGRRLVWGGGESMPFEDEGMEGGSWVVRSALGLNCKRVIGMEKYAMDGYKFGLFRRTAGTWRHGTWCTGFRCYSRALSTWYNRSQVVISCKCFFSTLPLVRGEQQNICPKGIFFDKQQGPRNATLSTKPPCLTVAPRHFRARGSRPFTLTSTPKLLSSSSSSFSFPSMHTPVHLSCSPTTPIAITHAPMPAFATE